MGIRLEKVPNKVFGKRSSKNLEGEKELFLTISCLISVSAANIFIWSRLELVRKMFDRKVIYRAKWDSSDT